MTADCFFHATADQNTAVRYAYGAYGSGSGSVLQISVPAVVALYGAEVVRPVCTKSERVELNIAEDGREASKVQLPPSAAARGGGAWCRNV